MQTLVTGVSGLLGLNVASTSSCSTWSNQLTNPLAFAVKHTVEWGIYKSHPVSLPEVETFPLDLTDKSKDESAVCNRLARIKPQAILHTAGLTNVDACENNPAEAKRLNVVATETVARAAWDAGAKLVHISTDHLSDGTKALVTEDAPPSPLNEYARTKLEAEQAVIKICPEALIIRTNFFGWGTQVKASFSDWILEGLKQGKEIPLFVDVYITPILINDLWEIIGQLLDKGAEGVFNVAGSERVSKYEFGVRLAKVFGYPTSLLRPVSVRDVALKAHRPLDMSLSTEKVSDLLAEPMPTLQASLEKLKMFGERGWPEFVRQALADTSRGSQ